MTLDQLPKQEGISHFAIIKILKSFSEDEINEFGKFLNSPFFNNHSTLTRLYAELKKHHPDYSDWANHLPVFARSQGWPTGETPKRSALIALKHLSISGVFGLVLRWIDWRII